MVSVSAAIGWKLEGGTPAAAGLALPHRFGEGDVAGLSIELNFGGVPKTLARWSSNSPSHLATTTVARQLPIRFTQVRPMSKWWHRHLACGANRLPACCFGFRLAGETPTCPTGKMPVLRSVLSYCFREGDVTGFQIELGFGGGAEDFGAVVVELAFPSRDDDGGEAVADQVYADAAHVHQFIDAARVTNR